jgi:hypothetical protein
MKDKRTYLIQESWYDKKGNGGSIVVLCHKGEKVKFMPGSFSIRGTKAEKVEAGGSPTILGME